MKLQNRDAAQAVGINIAQSLHNFFHFIYQNQQLSKYPQPPPPPDILLFKINASNFRKKQYPKSFDQSDQIRRKYMKFSFLLRHHKFDFEYFDQFTKCQDGSLVLLWFLLCLNYFDITHFMHEFHIFDVARITACINARATCCKHSGLCRFLVEHCPR